MDAQARTNARLGPDMYRITGTNTPSDAHTAQMTHMLQAHMAGAQARGLETKGPLRSLPHQLQRKSVSLWRRKQHM